MGDVVVVGICGGSASGKTTVARAVTEALGDEVLLISHDRYYRTVPDPRVFNYDEPAALDSALLVENLRDLRANRPAALPRYEYRTHSRLPEPEVVRPRPVVLVEGILVMAEPALREAMDLRVYVHVDADVRLARRLLRDVVERGRDAEGVVRQYLRDVRPGHLGWVEPARHHADLELDGTRPVAELTRRVLDALQSHRASR